MTVRCWIVALALPACTFDGQGVDWRLASCDADTFDAPAHDASTTDAALTDGPIDGPIDALAGDATAPDATDAASLPDAAGPCPTYAHVGSWYYLANLLPLVFTDAESACEASGGHLIAIGDGAEDVAARSFFPVNYLTGLSADATFTFTWVDGSALGYANWHAGRPLDAPGAVRMEVAYSDGTWYDVDDQAFPYLCECEP